ncbi:monoglyceride lipase isoform X3 [Ictalurus punctatus]|uniref:Monoglyceride lipase isoform X3 n=1 Tax=Ictalurus punctatus TaxID=7998 RepID=A0A2D0QZ47_ICTPU|nr:monoglyceride lipase isoform X3 [Ictalurus punctatus]
MPEAEGSGRTPQGVPYSELPHIINADGLHLFCRYWEPEGPPKALVFVVHGAGEHCSAYADVAHTLTQHSLFVFAHDHVGHGQSEGERMNIKNFQIYIRDCLQHIDLIRTRYPNLPIFILGHSMGGAISILTACEKPQDFAGVVLIAPMIQMNPESATPFKVFIAKVLNHMAPSLAIGSIDPKSVSRDPNQVNHKQRFGVLKIWLSPKAKGRKLYFKDSIPTLQDHHRQSDSRCRHMNQMSWFIMEGCVYRSECS